jgi:hypothetical protein
VHPFTFPKDTTATVVVAYVPPAAPLPVKLPSGALSVPPVPLKFVPNVVVYDGGVIPSSGTAPAFTANLPKLSANANGSYSCIGGEIYYAVVSFPTMPANMFATYSINVADASLGQTSTATTTNVNNPPPPKVPLVPVVATVDSDITIQAYSNSANFSVHVSANGSGGGVSFIVSVLSGGIYTPFANVFASETLGATDMNKIFTATVTGLTPSTTYQVHAVASNYLGETTGSNFAFKTTASTSTSEPSILRALVGAITSTSADFQIALLPAGQSVSWSISYGTTVAFGSTQTTGYWPPGNQTLVSTPTVSGLAPSTLYYYQVSLLYNNGANIIAGPVSTFKTIA